MISEFWWPLELSEEATDVFIKQKLYHKKNQVSINKNDLDLTNSLIEKMMKSNLQDILDRDSIPNLCHIINGWGNSQFNDKSLVDELGFFIFLKDGTQPFIEQCTTEGDFHPWQSFAYSAMAGISGDTIIGNSNYTLSQLMQGSVDINHDEGEELGHLLYALAYYFKGTKDDSFVFNFYNGEFNSEELLNWAIKNHFSGSFRVCRKFHLTEGICAMASLNPNFSEYKLVAQKFLEGQVDLIIVLSIILDESIKAIEDKKSLSDNSIAHVLREQLVVLDYLENHIYYAGHIIELASLALLMGYEISTEQKNGIVSVINNLNKLIPIYAPKMSFVDCFLGFGHYRRAITLYNDLENSDNKQDWSLLNNYTLNFNSIDKVDFNDDQINLALKTIDTGVFKITEPQETINPVLREVIAFYNQHADTIEYPLRGKFAHFRRVCPNGWPKSVHFEILDYGNEHEEIGIEIHLESEEVKYIMSHFEELQIVLNSKFDGLKFEIDQNWYNGSGRLFLEFSYKDNPEHIAKSFIQLIEVTKDKIDKIIEEKYKKIY